mmetsp:Transcript_25462/g.73553  ORF Transcript_25462/g.73553 Transcript_25462/m.73553 type:complete len:242 (-) Transcript_25462:270-995(-)
MLVVVEVEIEDALLPCAAEKVVDGLRDPQQDSVEASTGPDEVSAAERDEQLALVGADLDVRDKGAQRKTVKGETRTAEHEIVFHVFLGIRNGIVDVFSTLDATTCRNRRSSALRARGHIPHEDFQVTGLVCEVDAVHKPIQVEAAAIAIAVGRINVEIEEHARHITAAVVGSDQIGSSARIELRDVKDISVFTGSGAHEDDHIRVGLASFDLGIREGVKALVADFEAVAGNDHLHLAETNL